MGGDTDDSMDKWQELKFMNIKIKITIKGF